MNNDNSIFRLRVFNHLENAILDGKYKDNESLNELKISQELNVSRTPVREAIMQLELEGLVKNIPNKGAIVIGISEKDIEDIYAIRIRVEGLASRLSAQNINKEELLALEQIADLQEFFLIKNDIAQLEELDSKFHTIIYESSRSRPLRFMLSTFHNYIKHARGISFQAEGRAINSINEHRKILNAISCANIELAEEVTAEHITNAKESLLSELKKNKSLL